MKISYRGEDNMENAFNDFEEGLFEERLKMQVEPTPTQNYYDYVNESVNIPNG